MNDYLRPIYLQSIWETLFMALITLVIGGICGLVLGILLYATRRGGLLANKIVHTILNVIVNIIRPIPFIIFMTAIAPPHPQGHRHHHRGAGGHLPSVHRSDLRHLPDC